MPSTATFAFAAPPAPRPAPPEASRGLRWPFVGWSLPWWWAVWGLGWWRASLRQLRHVASLEPGLATVAPWAAIAVVAARGAGLLLESGFYVAFWRTRGARLPFWRYAVHVMLGSFLDLLTLELVAARPPEAPLAPWLVALAGPAAAPHAFARAHPVLVGAFASAGLVTLARWCWVAWAQAQATRRPFWRPLLLTAAMWLATHLAVAAALALAQGRSVLR